MIRFVFTIVLTFILSQQHVQERPNPLPECPESPNCERVGVRFEASANELREAVISALMEMNAEKIDAEEHSDHIAAVFRIPVFGFRDDVAVAIDGEAEPSVVYIRSASREGYYDLGVNGRRVKKLIKHIQRSLDS